MKKLLMSWFIGTYILTAFLSCRENDFYTSGCGFDCNKIPLIKPYYLGNTDGVNDGSWYVTDINKDGREVSVINVLDSIIISYYYDKYILIPENRDTSWYIHIPSQNKEYKFLSEEEFYSKVAQLTSKKIEFIEIPILYEKYIKDGYLDWFPDKYKNK